MDGQPEHTRSRRRSWLGWIAVVAVLAALVAALVGSVGRSASGGRIAGEVARGEHPAAPVLQGTSSGSRASADVTWSGHVTVVNFWASWCGPCDAETRDLTSLDRRWHGTAARIIGADPAAEDSGSDARSFVRAHRMHYRVVRFPPRLKRAWGVTGYPETFVVGRTGRIVAKFDGPIDVDRLEAAVQAELDAKP